MSTGAHSPSLPLAHNAGRCSLLSSFRVFNDHTLAVQQLPEGTVFIFADGLGGEKAGITVSPRAVDLLPWRLQTNFSKARGRDEFPQAPRRAIVETTEDLIALAAKDEALLNMGTTVVWAVWPVENDLYVNGVGDCCA
jgi:serine/threonine protein phosphatase PrpC